MNWYKFAQYDQYGVPLSFKEEVEAPTYQSLLSDREMGWHSPPEYEYKRGPTRDYMREMKGMTGEIEWMTPDEYINLCSREAHKNAIDQGQTDKTYEEFRDMIVRMRRNSIGEDDRSLIEEYQDRWISGEQPPMGYIIYSRGSYFGQEGMHRALMAKDLGVSEIPVLIINKE
jgi:hypothetical protein